MSGVKVRVGAITFDEFGDWYWQQTYNSNKTDTNGNYTVTVSPGSNYYAQVYNTPSGWLGGSSTATPRTLPAPQCLRP